MKKQIIQKAFLPVAILFIFFCANAQKNDSSITQDSLRTQAISLFFGCPMFDEPKCKTIMYQLAKFGDIKAMGWLSLFSFLGACGSGKNDDDGVFWAYRHNSYDRLVDLASNGDIESMFLVYELFEKLKLASYSNVDQNERNFLSHYLEALITQI